MSDGLLAAHLFGSVVSQMNNLRLLLPQIITGGVDYACVIRITPPINVL